MLNIAGVSSIRSNQADDPKGQVAPDMVFREVEH